jgi:pimeloyl-ACP methyl ester carboxylesterase
MASPNKPVVVIVPGAWHRAAQFSTLTDRLEAVGYIVKLADYPSTGPSPDDLPENIDGDIAAIQKVLTPLAEKGHDIVLVAHSAGGLLASHAAQGFAKSERSDGGIVKLVYLCAFAIPEGQSINGISDRPPMPRGVRSIDARSLNPVSTFYNLCPPEVAEAQVPQLGYFAASTLDAKATYTAWKHIPSAYLVCENDNTISVLTQEKMATQPGARFEIGRCGADHSPWLSMPDITAEFVRRAAGEVI